ncbi:hypothetical protein [Halovenus halobia]|uniref:hypothetical protein n=1 Tax=Halovenus halobia TaxID=3396622 RepID=UPI003F55044C
MSESLADVDIEEADPFRAAAVLSSLVIFASYLLPWARIDGPAEPIDGGGAVVNLSETLQASVAAGEISIFPEVVLGVALAALVIAAFRWTIFLQFLVGILGLAAAFVALLMWAVISTDSQSELVRVGNYAGLPSSFSAGIGLWLAIFGSLGLVLAGFAAATRTYVQVKRLEAQQE